MSDTVGGRSVARRGAVRAAAVPSVVGAVALTVLAWRADTAAPQAVAWLTALDVGVGLVLVASAALAIGGLPVRVLVAGVGLSWLAGSVAPVSGAVHQTLLALVLIAFPGGRITGRPPWLLVGLAVPVGFQLVPQVGVAVLFASIAVLRWAGSRVDPISARFPTAAGCLVAAVLMTTWFFDHVWLGKIEPQTLLAGYEVVLIVVGIGFARSTRAMIRAPAAIAEWVAAPDAPTGLDGLETVLGMALHDPDLRVYRSGGGVAEHRPERPSTDDANQRRLVVGDHGSAMAVVSSRSTALDDARTAAGVSSAVRLAITHMDLLAAQHLRLHELESSRGRIIAAADRQRAVAAAELRSVVDAPLRQAVAAVRSVDEFMPGVVDALTLVLQELSLASAEISALVEGVPPVPLGAGALHKALTALAARAPIPVAVSMEPDAAGDTVAETALYYVCSEALTNALKHAGAGKIAIEIGRHDGFLVATVSDDGCGGADASGSGLQGLADRVATAGGRFRVDSPPGAGTTVTAMIPVQPILSSGLRS